MVVGVLFDQGLNDLFLHLGRRRKTVTLLALGGCIDDALVFGQGHAHFHAVSRCDVTLSFDVLPGCVITLGADERKDIAFATVLAHERGGQTQTTLGLDVGGETEDGRGQQVDLVVHDQAPVVLIKEIKVCVHTLFASGQDLISGNRDRLDFLLCTGVLTDFIFGQGGALEEFASPLVHRHGVGDQDQGGGLGHGHGSSAHDGLASTTGENDYSAATASEVFRGFTLVGT